MKNRLFVILTLHASVISTCVAIHVHGLERFFGLPYNISDIGGVGRTFDGIGGISGGGATSRLLVNYKEPFRSQILDFLFKPQFGASLHILKVEIGGDAQSTEGTEHSHMHSEDDENYTRGYEWWLMKEAKRRNPNIKLIGLPWAWPGWIGQGHVLPYANNTVAATYIAKWINGAKKHHDLTIDYVGIWNERPYDVAYIKELRRVLDMYDFKNVVIIAADDSYVGISHDILYDAQLANAVGIIGAHYPGTRSTLEAIKTGKPLWSSEDYSTYNDDIGAGCWARILNQNYVNGKISATIAWNLIASYYDDLPYKRTSLMTANEPWSGHYKLTSPLWVTAHTTQFTQPGWAYLRTVGHLQQGGSFVSFTDGKGNLTIVIETMSHEQSICIRPPLFPYRVNDQNASFLLGGIFKKITKLKYWLTQLNGATGAKKVFEKQNDIVVDEKGHFNLNLPTNVLVTLSTIDTARKGVYPTPPSTSRFPIPYRENFDPDSSFVEAFNFADQAGAFERFYNRSSDDGHSWTFRQVVTERPLTWCDDPDHGVTVIGDYQWSSVNVSVAVKMEGTEGVFVALRVDKGGCDMLEAGGLYFWLEVSGIWTITADIGREKVLNMCYLDQPCWISPFYETNWNNVSLGIDQKGKITAYLNGYLVWSGLVASQNNISPKGFVALGTKTFGFAQFDNFAVEPL